MTRPFPFFVDLEGQKHEGKIKLSGTDRVICQIYTEVDGYWVIDASTFAPGALDEWGLKCLLNVLTDMNLAWDTELNEFFKKEKKKEEDA